MKRVIVAVFVLSILLAHAGDASAGGRHGHHHGHFRGGVFVGIGPVFVPPPVFVYDYYPAYYPPPYRPARVWVPGFWEERCDGFGCDWVWVPGYWAYR